MSALAQVLAPRARAALRTVARPVVEMAVRPLTRRWSDYSKLILVTDASHWAIAEELRALRGIATRLGAEVLGARWAPFARGQSLFYGSHLSLLDCRDWPVASHHRIGTAFYHGRPGSGELGFDRAYAQLQRHHERVHRVQVSHSEMRDLVLESGIDPSRVFQIPIGVDLRYFSFARHVDRRRMRQRLGIPDSAVVLGSFQKDGIGWGEGTVPKLIKGPDVLLKTVERVRERVPELFLLLSGPARGYVRAGLERLGVPYRHVYPRRYSDVGPLYHALDAYVVTSRQEGGPKAVLESMASGVPLVTTRVGQAMDLIVNEVNGWMVAVDDVEALVEAVLRAIEAGPTVVVSARRTAETLAHDQLDGRWRALLEGFVDLPPEPS